MLTPLSVLLLKDKALNLKPEKAWLEGTNLKAAIKENPAMVRGWIMAEVGRLIKELDTNKTIAGDEELIFCCNAIVEEHPTIKLEEIRACFNMIRRGKFGKLFERLKTPEILEFLCRYEGEVRAEIIERLHNKRKSEDYKPIVRSKEYKPLAEYLKDVLNEPIPKREFDRAGARLKKRLDKEYPNPDERP